jgi:hypothetical protein
MESDPSWFREMARKWRDFAAVCNAQDQAKRLKLADELEALAANLERVPAKGGR